ncbi:hypothetical protein CBR_g73492, partial [Chara braunii]
LASDIDVLLEIPGKLINEIGDGESYSQSLLGIAASVCQLVADIAWRVELNLPVPCLVTVTRLLMKIASDLSSSADVEVKRTLATKFGPAASLNAERTAKCKITCDALRALGQVMHDNAGQLPQLEATRLVKFLLSFVEQPRSRSVVGASATKDVGVIPKVSVLLPSSGRRQGISCPENADCYAQKNEQQSGSAGFPSICDKAHCIQGSQGSILGPHPLSEEEDLDMLILVFVALGNIFAAARGGVLLSKPELVNVLKLLQQKVEAISSGKGLCEDFLSSRSEIRI